MPFPANQVISDFHEFILLLKAIFLAAVCVIASHQDWTSVSSLWLVRYHLSSYISCVPQQLNSRKNGKICGHRVESSLGSLVRSSDHSTIIITNMLINQVGSYYVITNFYLIWGRSQLYPVTQMISLLLHLTLVPPWSYVITITSFL